MKVLKRVDMERVRYLYGNMVMEVVIMIIENVMDKKIIYGICK
jgi:hypothetical protein